MKLRLTVTQLQVKGACPEGIAAFRQVFGADETETEWTRERQIKLLRGPLGQYLPWAHCNGFIPWWSLSRADLSRADLSGANLSGSTNLAGAKICQYGSSGCAALVELLEGLGWIVARDGLLDRKAPLAPASKEDGQ